jgi:hypothetical protein
MVDPVTTITAGAIVQLAFQSFLSPEAGKASASKLSESLTEKVLTQMGELRQKIWGRLRFKSRKMQALSTAVRQTQQVTSAQIDDIAAYLRMEMEYDDRFATELKQLAERIYQDLRGEPQGSPLLQAFGGQPSQWMMPHLQYHRMPQP